MPWHARFGAAIHGRKTLVKKSVVAIVDDDASVLTATARLVSLSGFVAHAFSSAEEFLQSPYLLETSCLITDIRMPGMGGAELRRHLGQLGLPIPTIFITAFQEIRAPVDCKKSGAAFLLTKPFSGETLIACLKEALQMPMPEATDSGR